MHSDSMLPYLMPFAVPDAENPFGVPDWRNLHEYPDPELTPLRQWRWQFLRRDPSYRSSWETFRTNVIEWSDSSGGTSKHDETARRYGLCELISPAAPQLIDHWGLDAQTLKWVVIPAGYSEADVRDFVTETRARGFFLAAIDPSAALSSQLDRIQTEVSSWSPEFWHPIG
jgi:hypothetical protein